MTSNEEAYLLQKLTQTVITPEELLARLRAWNLAKAQMGAAHELYADRMRALNEAEAALREAISALPK